MSTKNLAKTVIEGGRTQFWKDVTHKAEKSFRQNNRNYCDFFDENSDVLPLKERHNKHWYQTDHLNPMYKFLDSRIGQCWDKVYSEICSKFDGKSWGQLHVLNQHLIPSVFGYFGNPEFPSNYYVDKNGIFLKRKERFRRSRFKQKTDFDNQKLCDFLNRKEKAYCIISSGDKLFWGEAIQKDLFWKSGSSFFLTGIEYHDYIPTLQNTSFRSSGALNKEEMEYYNSLPDWVKEKITK